MSLRWCFQKINFSTGDRRGRGEVLASAIFHEFSPSSSLLHLLNLQEGSNAGFCNKKCDKIREITGNSNVR